MDFNQNFNQPPQFEAPPQIDSQKISPLRTVILAIIVVIILALASYIFIKMKINSPLARSGSSRVFVIQPGTRERIVASDLYDQGLISSAWAFDLYMYTSGNTQKIQAGNYVLSPAMSVKQIADQLITGKVQQDTDVVQIIEGWTLDDIGNYLQQNNIAKKTDFSAAEIKVAKQGIFGEKLPDMNLEGYIFPDTYFVSKGSSVDVSNEIVSKAVANLQNKFTPQMLADIATQKKSVYDILTMASIVEKEVGRHEARLSEQDLTDLDQERKIVAGIFYKRLSIGMKLESDATTLYATRLKNTKAQFEDLQIDSPYNTYKYFGLPPGPIGNPSLSSIMAAIYPTKSDYLYFLNKPDGTAVFAKTLQEQNRNRAMYLK